VSKTTSVLTNVTTNAPVYVVDPGTDEQGAPAMRKDRQMTEEASDPPVRVDELIDALRNEPGGEDVADRLASLLGHVPPFELPSAEGDPWVLVRSMLKLLIEDRPLCEKAFGDAWNGFLAGTELGYALAMHHGVFEPFRTALDKHGQQPI
jgi:hypothetical protein